MFPEGCREGISAELFLQIVLRNEMLCSSVFQITFVEKFWRVFDFYFVWFEIENNTIS